MNLFSKLLVYILFFVCAVVISELALLFFLGDQGKIILNNLVIQKSEKNQACPVPTGTVSNEAVVSCSNWFSKYKHIDSSETTTRGTFSHMEENPKTHETRVFFTGQRGTYYVSFDSEITVVTIVDTEGQKLQKSSLKKGDYLRVVEKYLKANDDSENFSVIITRQ